MTFPGYNFEAEGNDHLIRVGVYIKSQIKYVRRVDLEGSNSNLIIIDIIDKETLRIINIYRSFKPPNGVS